MYILEEERNLRRANKLIAEKYSISLIKPHNFSHFKLPEIIQQEEGSTRQSKESIMLFEDAGLPDFCQLTKIP